MTFSLSKTTTIVSENNLARLFVFLKVKIAVRGYLLFVALKSALGIEGPPGASEFISNLGSWTPLLQGSLEAPRDRTPRKHIKIG